MKLDLRKDFKDIHAYVVRRVKTFDSSHNAGPGEAGAEVAQITFGYQCDQAGWVALVFDTRPGAECDGEWNGYIAENTFERPRWEKACESLEEQPVDVVLPDGSALKLTAETDEEEYMAVFGDLLKQVFVKAREEGVFESLPKAKRCHLCVEEMDGRYGWPRHEDRDKDGLA